MERTGDEPIRYERSTTWRYTRVKVRQGAAGQQESGAKRRRWWGLPPLSGRDAVTLKVSYRGGSECWYEIHARGRVGRFTGVAALHDVMAEILQMR